MSFTFFLYINNIRIRDFMWFYKNIEIKDISEEYLGFIYQITNLTNGRIYIGKKKSTFKRKCSKVKYNTDGKKSKRKEVYYKYFPSDWIEYYGSSKSLQKDIDELGKDLFKREIIYFCKTDSDMSYMESDEIFRRKALLSKKFYNEWVSCKISKNNLKNIALLFDND